MHQFCVFDFGGFGTYTVFVTVHRRKIRLNLTVDPDIYREAKVYLDVMDKTLSSLMQDSLLAVVTHMKPLKPLLGRKDVPDNELKLALLMLAANANSVVSGEISSLAHLAASIGEGGTDKKAQD
jgi:hypothetical protein